MTIQEYAAMAGDALRALLAPDVSHYTRKREAEAWRDGMARTMAEAATGVTHNHFVLYRSDQGFRHDAGYRALANQYEAALWDAYGRLPLHYAELLPVLDNFAAEPLAMAAD